MAESVSGLMGWRTDHTNQILGDDLIIWGGDSAQLPRVHTSAEKTSILTKLDKLNIPSLQWDTVTTTGTPPAGAMEYGSISIRNDMYVFGGTCNYDCHHNELHHLNTNKVWRSVPTTAATGPMKKRGCGLTSYSYQGSDYLLTLGGEGGRQLPTQQQQQHSLYIPDAWGRYYTNEVHTMNITTSLGEWVSPRITGDRPPPMARFTINVLPNNRMKAIVFGGRIATKKNDSHCSNDAYCMTLTDNTVNFTKLSPQSHSTSQWPEPRQHHASTIISSNETDHLLIIGGMGGVRLGWVYPTIVDCWVLNMSTKRWSQINLPKSVCGRRYHSVSSITINTNTVWIIVTGGNGMGGFLLSPIKGVDVTMIAEIEYKNDEWIVNGVWNSTQKQELIERRERMRQPITTPLQEDDQRNEEMRQEIVQLRQELIQVRTEQTEQIREKENTIHQQRGQLQQRDTTIREKDTTIREKDASIREKDASIREKDASIREKDTVIRQTQQQTGELHNQVEERDAMIQERDATIRGRDATIRDKNNALDESNHQIRTLNARIQEKDNIIERNDTTIAEQYRQITRYRDNPHWVIQREEVTITQDTLGKGGWGEVKVGVFRGTKVAVKSIYQAIRSQHYMELFAREMDIASRIRHPNLLQFIGATREGNLLIVTEIMPTSLRTELEKNQLLRAQVIAIAIHIVSALNYLHMWRPRPILHRDVSSANVLLEPLDRYQYKAKLSDYGSVNLQENVQTTNPGSPVYSAPEADTPAQHSPAMDIFSFAILLVEMTIRRFPSDTPHEREAQIREVKWSNIRSLITRCTVTNPNDRPNTNNVLAELRDMYSSEFN